MKKCKECKIERPLDGFDKVKGNTDGRCGYCKECRKKKTKFRYNKNKDVFRLKISEYRKKNPERRKVESKKYREKYKEEIKLKRRFNYLKLNEDQKEKKREAKRKFDKTEKGKQYNKNYRVKNGKILRARWELNNAIRDGKIERGNKCITCLSEINIEAHHTDYNNPLEVVWLCRECHISLHKSLNRRKKNASS